MKPNFKATLCAILGTTLLATGIATVNVPTRALASGGSGGGGGGGGGGGTVTPAITSFKAVPGYRPNGGATAAIWTSYSVQVPSGTTPIVHITITDAVTGQCVFNSTYYSTSATIDDDFMPFSTTFVVRLDLVDYSGIVLDSRSATVTTPAPKSGTTAG